MMLILRRGFCTHLASCSYTRGVHMTAWTETRSRKNAFSNWAQSLAPVTGRTSASWSLTTPGRMIESGDGRFQSHRFVALYTVHPHGVMFEGRLAPPIGSVAQHNAVLRSLT